jgi:hypothetical protein
MHKTNFEITEKDTVEVLRERLDTLISKIIFDLPCGMWEMVIRKPTRTLKQNSCIHALFPDLATELDGLGVPNKKGKLDIPWDEREAKEFFIHAYNHGKRTSKSTTKEIADATRRCLDSINKGGGQLSIKDKGLEELLKNN